MVFRQRGVAMARQTSKKLNDGQGVSAKTKRKSSTKKPAAIVYEGLCSWGDEELGEFLGWSDGIIGKVILRENEVAFDWISDEKEAVQHTHLTTTDGIHYVGYTAHGPGHGDDRARIDAVLYSNAQGHILLGQGAWEQDGRTESFIIQLHTGKPVGEQ
jgi:hypothetical protein